MIYKHWFSWKNKNIDSFEEYVTKLESALNHSIFLEKTSSDVQVGTTFMKEDTYCFQRIKLELKFMLSHENIESVSEYIRYSVYVN